MTKLSEESLLLIRNWDGYQDILKATDRLRTEMTSVLTEAELRLKKQDWWGDGWCFKKRGEDQCYITHRRWLHSDKDLIWIGVEQFDPDSVLGDAESPSLYVWVLDKRFELKQSLVRIVKGDGERLLGEIDDGPSTYVVRKPLTKCLPEEVDRFPDIMFDPIIEFMTFYAKYVDTFAKAVKAFIETKAQ